VYLLGTKSFVLTLRKGVYGYFLRLVLLRDARKLRVV
jgi:hypothetical protein